MVLDQPLSSSEASFGQRVVEHPGPAGPAKKSLPPIAHESHLDRFVCQLEALFRGQEPANLETVELLSRLEEAEQDNLELVIVHSCEA